MDQNNDSDTPVAVSSSRMTEKELAIQLPMREPIVLQHHEVLFVHDLCDAYMARFGAYDIKDRPLIRYESCQKRTVEKP